MAQTGEARLSTGVDGLDRILDGELRKTVGVLRKRAGSFERTLREFELGPGGPRVGEQLKGLRGILSGMPELMRGALEQR